MKRPAVPLNLGNRARAWLRPAGRLAPVGPLTIPATAASDQGPLFDEELLAQLRRLVLASRRTIAEGLAGEHRSRRRGSSPEFADFKSYSQGDDFRRIDWNTYARLDDLFVRLSEVTTEFNVHLLLDCSNSMEWRGHPRLPTKFFYARQIAGAIAYISLWHFDRVVVAPFGETLGHRFGPSQGRSHIVPMLRYLEGLQPLGGTDLPGVIATYARALRRPGVMLIVSDLLSGEPAAFADALRDLRARGWQTTVVHVADPVELSPTAIGGGDRPEASELIELETGQRLRLTPTPAVVARYREALEAWLHQIGEACEAERTDYVRLQTDWPLETIVLRVLHQRGVVA
jgi:uncharacterized protein (DUF58 family)